MSNMNDEPSLDKIDDFNDKESPEKRNTVRFIIIALLIIGAIFGYMKATNNEVSDYEGTKDAPGIDVTKGK